MKQCEWIENLGSGQPTWITHCGWQLELTDINDEGRHEHKTPGELGWTYCPHCGRELQIVWQLAAVH